VSSPKTRVQPAGTSTNVGHRLFVERAVELPLGQLERAGSGDLSSRITNDVNKIGEALRYAVPEFTRSSLVIALTLVGLARVILIDPPVAILDEATAEAGSAGARILEQAADAALEGRTALVVAHRLTQAATADQIVVLDHGRVVESGTHAELVKANGRYAELWTAWSGTRT
jgi:ABC-type multidrug transport system fused ATPase/permease subunit